MAYLSNAFGLPPSVPFVDVDVDHDNRIFVDPSAIRNGSCRYSIQADARLISFFEEVLHWRRSLDLVERSRGLDTLQCMREPGQTRLGYSARGTDGKGFGKGLGRTLWDALGDPVCSDKALHRIEHLPLFLEGVGKDLISDMVTRIVMDILVDFTQEMMVSYPQLARETSIEAIMLWDPNTLAWVERDVELPYIGGKQLILLPLGWVSDKLLMSDRPYYNRYTTRQEQLDLTTYDRDGKRDRPTKEAIKADHPEVRTFNRNRTVQDLGKVAHIRLYQREVDEKFTPMDAARIREHLNKELDEAS